VVEVNVGMMVITELFAMDQRTRFGFVMMHGGLVLVTI
jgi:hypothetical protein